MAPALDELALENARDLEGRSGDVWVRRVLLLLVAVIPVLALLNVFGQTASEATASSSVAKLTVRSPTAARGGLLFEVRMTVEAHQDIKNATLSLGGGWANGLTFNAIEPQPSQESSSHGELSLQIGSMSAGDISVLHLYYQVNPTTTGSRRQQVALLDGQTPIVALTRHLTVYP
jgi:hypothetical protein